jgi:energy-coupling factor transport system permease protein
VSGLAPTGASWLHVLSPIPKLAWLASVVVYAFVSFAAWPLAAIAGAGIAIAASAGILRSVVRALLALAPLAASILVIQAINPAACGASCTPAAQVGPLTVWIEGVERGLVLVVRILAMEVAALVVFQTTQPTDLFAALARLRVPYLFNVMLALTLQLVPVLEREVRIVLAAQRARGMHRSGFAALVPAFVPVFAGAFERVERLAIGWESRGFGASGPRTSWRRIRYGPEDRLLAVAGLAAGVVGVASAALGWQAPAPSIVLPAGLAVAIVAAAVAVFASALVVASRALSGD